MQIYVSKIKIESCPFHFFYFKGTPIKHNKIDFFWEAMRKKLKQCEILLQGVVSIFVFLL